jgi:hypothetical protein
MPKVWSARQVLEDLIKSAGVLEDGQDVEIVRTTDGEYRREARVVVTYGDRQFEVRARRL